jgi:hypothetical protein
MKALQLGGNTYPNTTADESGSGMTKLNVCTTYHKLQNYNQETSSPCQSSARLVGSFSEFSLTEMGEGVACRSALGDAPLHMSLNLGRTNVI